MHPLLQEFLARPENVYQWQCLSRHKLQNTGVEEVQLELTSQTWREGQSEQVNHGIWQHRLTLYFPESRSNKPCLLMINGGYRHDPAMEATPSSQIDGAYLCQLTNAPVAILKDVPNQPLCFASGKPRNEDDLVAWSWQQFLADPQAHRFYPLQWPMVKSVVKAMDAITEFTDSESSPTEAFILSGASKRGWTSWLTAATDFRVAAVIPIVIDVLNVRANIHHHHNVYNGWASAISDYSDPDHNVLESLDTEAMQALLQQVDPLSYMDQLQLPKYIINASSDEFFPPDSARFYYQQLPAPKWLRYLPNSSHYIGRETNVNTTDLMASAFGAFSSEQSLLPDMAWQILDSGGVELKVSQKPDQARVWLCHNPKQRDFRKETLLANNIRYESYPLEPDSQTPWTYCFTPETSQQGWTAFFIEASFSNPPYPDLKLTTGIQVLPDVYPDA